MCLHQALAFIIHANVILVYIAIPLMKNKIIKCMLHKECSPLLD